MFNSYNHRYQEIKLQIEITFELFINFEFIYSFSPYICPQPFLFVLNPHSNLFHHLFLASLMAFALEQFLLLLLFIYLNIINSFLTISLIFCPQELRQKVCLCFSFDNFYKKLCKEYKNKNKNYQSSNQISQSSSNSQLFKIYAASCCSRIIIQTLIFTMNLFDDLDAELNENSLDMYLGLQPSPCQADNLFKDDIEKTQEKQICVTYQWIWNDEEPIQQATPLTQDSAIDEMKSARAEQEEKVKRFIANIKPINTLTRKISMEVTTQAGSPKKKKIRKMVSYR